MTSTDALEPATPVDELEAARARIAELETALQAKEEERKRIARIATDRQYMMDSYRSMLGPKGLEVVKLWDEKNVRRHHTSWGPEAHMLTGEERAQTLLDVENMPRTLVEDLDEHDAARHSAPRS